MTGGTWDVTVDESGNHAYCNALNSGYSVVLFGSDSWKNYAVELRVKALEFHQDPYVSIMARINPAQNYYGALNFQTHIADLSLNEPYRSISKQSYPTTDNTWYILRLEVARSQLKFFIDNQLVGEGSDATLTQGPAAFNTSPDTRMCLDDIRVWSLTKSGVINQVLNPIQTSLEVVTNQAATGEGAHAWGGHQTRIVRTQDGVFTAYTTAGDGPLARQWQLARRHEDGSWPVIAQGVAGQDPASLMAAPDGTLYIIGWPGGVGTMWSGKPTGDEIDMTHQVIPGVSRSNWPYSSTGINQNGDLCVLSSTGGEQPGGTFMWACFFQSTKSWISHTTELDYRYCYTYLFPGLDGDLSLISTRDVLWEALGYTKPWGGFPYVFNAVGFWRTNNIGDIPLERLFFMEEKPTVGYSNVHLNAQVDAYIDITGNMHVLYHIRGESTQLDELLRHAILSPDGQLINDVLLPGNLGYFARIFQDAQGRFYILGSSGLLYPAGMDGVTLDVPFQLDLQGYTVEYSGYGISVPRTGTPISNVLDVVFPSGNGKQWVYFQLTLPEN